MKAGWITKKLGELASIELGKTPSRSDKSLWDDGRTSNNVWLSIADLLNTQGNVVFDSKEYISDKGAGLSKIVLKGTLLVSFKLTLGRLAYAGKNLFTNEAIAALTIFNENELSKEFLFYFLHHFDWVKAAENDAKIKGMTLNKAKLKELAVYYPSIQEQQRIVAILDQAFEGIAKARANSEQNLQNARALFESHLQSVFTQRGDHWQMRKLGDTSLLKIIDGDRGANYPNKDDFKNEGYCLFLNTKNVRPDGFSFESKMFITEQKDKLLRNGKLQRQDVILTTRGTIGNLAIYDESVEFENVRINSGMLIFRPKPELIRSSYLFEVFRSGIMKNQIVRHVSGAAQPQLPIKTLIEFKIPVPNSLEQQNEIVNSVRTIEKETQRLEALYQRKIACLDELKKSLLHQAFAGEL